MRLASLLACLEALPVGQRPGRPLSPSPSPSLPHRHRHLPAPAPAPPALLKRSLHSLSLIGPKRERRRVEV